MQETFSAAGHLVQQFRHQNFIAFLVIRVVPSFSHFYLLRAVRYLSPLFCFILIVLSQRVLTYLTVGPIIIIIIIIRIPEGETKN